MHAEHQLRSSISLKDRAFLSRVSTLSVHPSVTFWYQMKTAQYIVIVFLAYGSPIILVLPASNIFTEFRRGHPLRGAKYRWGIKISRFSTNKSLHLANDTRYRHSYYGRRIGTLTSNGAISNDLERTLTMFSRSHHSLTLNISQTATNVAIVTIEDE